MVGRSTRTAWVRMALAGLAGVVVTLAVAAPAQAHNAFAGSTPSDGAVLDQAPATVRLTFLERLVSANVSVTITDPGGASAVAGPPAFDGATVLVPLRPTTGGLYSVGYAVKSTDGHPVTGKITFTLTAAAVPPPGSPPPGSPPPGSPQAVAPSADAPRVLAGDVAGDDAGGGGVGWWPWAVGGVLVLAGLGLVVARRRRSA